MPEPSSFESDPQLNVSWFASQAIQLEHATQSGQETAPFSNNILWLIADRPNQRDPEEGEPNEAMREVWLMSAAMDVGLTLSPGARQTFANDFSELFQKAESKELKDSELWLSELSPEQRKQLKAAVSGEFLEELVGSADYEVVGTSTTDNHFDSGWKDEALDSEFKKLLARGQANSHGKARDEISPLELSAVDALNNKLRKLEALNGMTYDQVREFMKKEYGFGANDLISDGDAEWFHQQIMNEYANKDPFLEIPDSEFDTDEDADFIQRRSNHGNDETRALQDMSPAEFYVYMKNQYSMTIDELQGMSDQIEDELIEAGNPRAVDYIRQNRQNLYFDKDGSIVESHILTRPLILSDNLIYGSDMDEETQDMIMQARDKDILLLAQKIIIGEVPMIEHQAETAAMIIDGWASSPEVRAKMRKALNRPIYTQLMLCISNPDIGSVSPSGKYNSRQLAAHNLVKYASSKQIGDKMLEAISSTLQRTNAPRKET